ncbi:MAG TPA: RNA polymerase sigma factor [Solirubrobacteraceae bacterium]|nr:RNA polymerase sigma factor [Solirubrobacteraceae bacterium]
MNLNTAPAPAAPPDETALVRLVAAGDERAFELLMRRFNRRLYRVARAVLHDNADAEDALQEAYLAAYRQMKLFRGDSALATWLTRLVLNECLGRRRRSQRRQNVVPIVPTDGEMTRTPARDCERPDFLLDRAQLRAILQHRLDELPESYRTVFVLRSVEELSVEETALSLSIPEATVRSRHFRAKSLLRDALTLELDLAEHELYEFGGTSCDRVTARVLQRLALERHPA